MKAIGRIVDYQSGWSWFQMDDAGDLEPGDAICVTPYVDGESPRVGVARIMGRMGNALHFDQNVCGPIPTIASRDCVYRAEVPVDDAGPLRIRVASLEGWCRYALENWAPSGSDKAEKLRAELETE